MSDIKKDLIKIAYENPELRDQLLPLIQKMGTGSDTGPQELNPQDLAEINALGAELDSLLQGAGGQLPAVDVSIAKPARNKSAAVIGPVTEVEIQKMYNDMKELNKVLDITKNIEARKKVEAQIKALKEHMKDYTRKYITNAARYGDHALKGFLWAMASYLGAGAATVLAIILGVAPEMHITDIGKIMFMASGLGALIGTTKGEAIEATFLITLEKLKAKIKAKAKY
jgi:hypothetical protein